METVKLGSHGAVVSRMGLGCMGMSEFYGTRDDAESAATILRSLDLGMTFLDTADMYGSGHNEELVGRTIKLRRAEVFLATKIANVRGPAGEFLGVRGDPEYVRQACDASDKPRYFTFPALTSSAIAPTVSSIGTFGSTRCW